MTMKYNRNDILRSRAVVAIIAMIATLQAWSQGGEQEIVRPVSSFFMIDAGGASIKETYLTPLRYKGLGLRLGYERMQAMKFSPERWVMQLEAGCDYARVKNPTGNHIMHSLQVDFKWGMMRRWHDVLTPKLQLAVGASTQFRGGVIYNAYNSNNPVSAKIHFSVGAMAMASYNVKLGKMPVTLRYEATLPALGAFFAPEYGESFYEIYLGNTSGLAHFGWWGNRFDMTNFVSADLHLGNTVLRVGYRGRIETSWVNNLSTQIFTNTAVLGVGGEWISVGRNKKVSEKAKFISAIY